ncbi:MAG TPA: hypothetical protein VM575_01565, partial [Nocardioides sp.]|nr:hypothetical protein [Nocardioides sp.]
MGYDTRSRDRSRRAVAGISGALAATVLVGTGAVTGEAARAHRDEERADLERQAEEYAAWQAEQAAYEAELTRSRDRERPVVVRQRPRRTRITTRYVTAAAPGDVTVRSGGAAPRSSGVSGGGGGPAS